VRRSFDGRIRVRASWFKNFICFGVFRIGKCGVAHHEIKPSDLPPPKLENEVNNGPKVIPQPEGAKLTLPSGFESSTFAEGGFQRPRWMALFSSETSVPLQLYQDARMKSSNVPPIAFDLAPRSIL
jgi:hypothetical protein